jgi:hypothetical protein
MMVQEKEQEKECPHNGDRLLAVKQRESSQEADPGVRGLL